MHKLRHCDRPEQNSHEIQRIAFTQSRYNTAHGSRSEPKNPKRMRQIQLERYIAEKAQERVINMYFHGKYGAEHRVKRGDENRDGIEDKLILVFMYEIVFVAENIHQYHKQCLYKVPALEKISEFVLVCTHNYSHRKRGA